MFKSLAARSRFQCACLSAFKIAFFSAAFAASREIALSEPDGFRTRLARLSSRPLSTRIMEETRLGSRRPSATMLLIIFLELADIAREAVLPLPLDGLCRECESLALESFA